MKEDMTINTDAYIIESEIPIEKIILGFNDRPAIIKPNNAYFVRILIIMTPINSEWTILTINIIYNNVLPKTECKENVYTYKYINNPYASSGRNNNETSIIACAQTPTGNTDDYGYLVDANFLVRSGCSGMGPKSEKVFETFNKIHFSRLPPINKTNSLLPGEKFIKNIRRLDKLVEKCTKIF